MKPLRLPTDPATYRSVVEMARQIGVSRTKVVGIAVQLLEERLAWEEVRSPVVAKLRWIGLTVTRT